jgi:CO dehydrogenase/acetyl-CoA synthase alpha subunit
MTGKKKRRREPTAEEMDQLAGASRDQAALAPPTFGPVTIEVDPELTRIKKTYSVREVIDMVRQAENKPKRGKGRPAIPNKLAILDAAALAKVRDGRYTQIAHLWKLMPQQLIDLVRHNRPYFASKVKALRKNASIKG